ncbi:MAG TPA: hypothetical protein VHY36_07230 [Steroidobacteraceae bacterium]|jgi:hypothetical protein|nr:hypothetical protein [Steroidobacteraceae bacterium]
MSLRARAVLGAIALGVATVASAQVQIRSQLPPPRITSMKSTPPVIAIDWGHVAAVSKVHGTTQLGTVGPGPLHQKIYQELTAFDAQYPRWQIWGGGAKDPNLGSAEPLPPANGVSHWDLGTIDDSLSQFVQAVKGQEYIVNLPVIPEWMYAPDPAIASDTRGPIARVFTRRRLVVSPRQVADYYARIVSWLEKGGFRDEFGKWHASGSHLKIPLWEVLNETDMSGMPVKEYTALYDATVAAVRKVDPDIRFVGLVMGVPEAHPADVIYFLDPRHHAPGTPLDAITLHFYGRYGPWDAQPAQVATTFAQAKAFIGDIGYVSAIRDRLSPPTQVMVDELGTIVGTEAPQVPWPKELSGQIPFHLRLSAAMYAYIYGSFAQMGVASIGQTGMNAGVAGGGNVGAYVALTMLTPGVGAPNVRYKAARLLMSEFPPGSKVVDSYTGIGYWGNPPPIYVQAFISPDGKRRVLLVNEQDAPYSVVIPGAKGARIHDIGDGSEDAPYEERLAASDTITLRGLDVAVLTILQ